MTVADWMKWCMSLLEVVAEDYRTTAEELQSHSRQKWRVEARRRFAHKARAEGAPVNVIAWAIKRDSSTVNHLLTSG